MMKNRKERTCFPLALAASFMLPLLFAPPPAAGEVGFTEKDRQILIELKVKTTEVEKRLDQVTHFFYILAGILTSMVIAVIGFGYWDRRTMIKEARREAIEFIEKAGLLRRLVDPFKDLAGEDSRLAGALKKFNIL